jgi:hypothetical protein
MTTAGPFAWYRESTPEARRALEAAGLGWMLDSFDVNLYALVLAAVMADLGFGKSMAGLIGSSTLRVRARRRPGMVADRYGRTRALIGSILIYSVFTGACGLAQTAWHLMALPRCSGSMGGEWAAAPRCVRNLARRTPRGARFVQSSWRRPQWLRLVTQLVLLIRDGEPRSSSASCPLVGPGAAKRRAGGCGAEGARRRAKAVRYRALAEIFRGRCCG